MSIRHLAPAAQWTEPASRVRLWTPVYPLYDPATGDLDWDAVGPATCALVYDPVTGEVDIDTDVRATGRLQTMIDASGALIFIS